MTDAIHEHELYILENKNGDWKCNGGSIFGNCKSGLDDFGLSHAKIRYSCKKCLGFDLCELCFKTPTNDNQTFTTVNHPHEFFLCEYKGAWRCDGGSLFGKCKSNLDNFNLNAGEVRYRCKTCHDFDLCQLCLTAPQFDIQLYTTVNHEHQFFISDRNNDGWRCNGGVIFGKCKSGLDRCGLSHGQTRYRCKECRDFDLCELCFAAEKVNIMSYKTKNHAHEFFISELNNGWTCDGGSIFGRCKSGFNFIGLSDGKTRYRCKTCTDFDLCELCFDYDNTSEQGSSNTSIQHSCSTNAVQPVPLCQICMLKNVEVSLIHLSNNTGHQVCCMECAQQLKSKNMKCPICREDIDLIIKNYIC